MKTPLLFGTIFAFLGATIASMSAQNQTTSYVQTSKLVGTKVKSAQGEEIGTVKDVVLDRNTGCMAYTVLSTGGTGTRVTGGGKTVAVPWSVYSPSSDLSALTVQVDRDRIYNAPAFDYARISEYSTPAYINNVYSYYGVSPGAGVGVSGATTTGATTTGATTTTGTARTAGAAASPAATGSLMATAPAAPATSPAATASAAATGSPRARASATPPHAETSESPHATASASPSTRGKRGRGRPQEAASPIEGHETTTSPETHGGRETTTSPETGESESGGESSTEKTKSTTGRHHGRPTKSETSTPSENPREQ